VTPHLVKPIEAEGVTVPTDDFVEPNDLDFYGFGKIERLAAAPAESSPTVVQEEEEMAETVPAVRRKETTTSRSGETPHSLDGDFGHVNP